MRVALSSTKGAPGTTTLAFALSRLWARRCEVLLVEADPTGGVLAARFGLSQEPGLGTLAAAGRHVLSGAVLAEHTQHGPASVDMILGPSSPHHARSALRASADGLRLALADLHDTTVVVDVGRLDAEEASWPLAASSDHVIVLTAPTLEGADALAVRLADLDAYRPRIHVVTTGDGPYDGHEIAAVCAVSFLGHLPHDPITAGRLWSSPERRARRSRPLSRATAEVADLIAAMYRNEEKEMKGSIVDVPAPMAAQPARSGHAR